MRSASCVESRGAGVSPCIRFDRHDACATGTSFSIPPVGGAPGAIIAGCMVELCADVISARAPAKKAEVCPEPFRQWHARLHRSQLLTSQRCGSQSMLSLPVLLHATIFTMHPVSIPHEDRREGSELGLLSSPLRDVAAWCCRRGRCSEDERECINNAYNQ